MKMDNSSLGKVFIIFLTIKNIQICTAPNSSLSNPQIPVEIEDVLKLSTTYVKFIGWLTHNKKATFNEIFNRIKIINTKMTQIEELLHSQQNDLINTLNTLSLKNNVEHQQERFNRHASYIIHQYNILEFIISSNDVNSIEKSTINDFARVSTRLGDHHLPNYVREFVELIVPRVNPHGGLLNLYSNYVNSMEQQNKWCDNEQSLSDFIYKSFRFTFNVMTKGYFVILKSYAIRKTLNKGNFRAEIKFIKREYKKSANAIVENLRKLAIAASTRIRRCDPHHQERGKTYLEMEKLFQGILVHKITMNNIHTAYYDCDYYQDQGAGYFPYPRIRSDGDWRCHGMMYKCFRSFAVDLCKPTTPNRRIDGFTAKNRRDWDWGEKVADNMGNLTNCNDNNIWAYYDWDNPNIFTAYSTEPCACICDDFQHPKTLRMFSRETVSSDYRNNMVITGIRFWKISNVIHLDIQQGKLEEFGFINSSTSHWRPRDEIERENKKSLPREPISFSYHERQVNLDTIYTEPNEVIIGVTFKWAVKGVSLAALGATFSFPTGKVNRGRPRWIFTTGKRTEIVMDKPHMPTMCTKNIPVREENKFVEFQTTDWIKDAAQTTIPYLDIQEVVTNPPALLQGIGLNYKNAAGCGGYIALEVYSYNYTNWIY